MKSEDITIAYLADGSSVHTERFLEYFVERGYRVHLITYTPSKMKNVKIHNIATPRTMVPIRIVQTVNLIRKIRPSILHAFYVTNNGFVGALSGFHPLVITPLGSDITTDPERSKILRFLVKFALRKADLVHAADTFFEKRLTELGCVPEKVFVQSFGVDTDLFSPEARSQSLRKEIGIDGLYSVLCARWWTPTYGVEILVKAAPLVLKKVPCVKFILLGGGPLENRLRRLAKELGVYEKILFVGKVPAEKMPSYLASIDLYVETISTYRADSVGKVVKARGESVLGQTNREVMACGTPQILSDMPSVKSSTWFRGLTYKQLDYKDLAEKIVQLLSDTKLRERIGEESRKTVVQAFAMDKTMRQWEKIYHDLCDARASNSKR